MKRVGIVIDWYLPRIGGAEIYTYHLAKYLAKNGYEVHIFTLDEKNTAGFIDEFPVTRVSYGKGVAGKIRFYRELSTFLDGVDIIHAIYCHKFAAYTGLYRLFHKKRFVITEQGRGILDLPGNNWLYKRVHSLYRYVSLKTCDAFIGSCLEFVEIAKKYTSSKKLAYIPNGVDLEVFGKDVPHNRLADRYRGKDIVLTVRRLVPKNGIQFLVEAAPRIIAAHPTAYFIFVGYGELEKYLRQRVNALGILDKVEFAGRVDNALVPAYLEAARAVVFPSTAESTSLACLEAMAMKKPIVASAVGGYPEMIEDGKNGFLVKLVDWSNSNYDAPLTLPDERLERLAGKITELLTNPQLAARFGEEAYRKVATVFSWEVLIQKIIALY